MSETTNYMQRDDYESKERMMKKKKKYSSKQKADIKRKKLSNAATKTFGGMVR